MPVPKKPRNEEEPPRESLSIPILAEQCGADHDRLKRMQHLLLAKSAAGSFLESAPVVAGTPPAEATATFEAAAAEPTSDYPRKDEHAGAVIGGKYTLVEAIGESGMGSVWRAKKTEPVKRFVAVKLIRPAWTRVRCWRGSRRSGRRWR